METNVLSGRLAIFRINYKSDFILTLESDAGWMTPFCIKFWTGAPSQAYYVGWDGETYTHCVPVEGEPTKLQVQFDNHHLPIGELKYQIAYHFTVDDFPNDTEDEVINQDAVIIDNNGRNEKVLLDFNGGTAPDIAFSLPAYANEAQRIANEQARIAAEQQRIANEDARIQAEETRQQNEQQRIDQETARVNEFATLKSQSQAATRDANDAATLANQKAQLAADKAALAYDAATLANKKAQLAADKAALANDAAQLAADKAALAQQKAEYAQTQGGYAKDQGDYAKNQGDYAKEQGDIAQTDHTRAEADHGIAVDDHTQAGNDHTRAESDHGIAVDDHTQAGNDHTRAESDHGIAVDDHTQAGNDHTRAESDHGIAADDHTQANNDHTRAESDHAAVEVYVDSLGAFDISAYNATGGVLAKYADLTAALGTNGENIPEGIRKGGMSVKFVQSSDNKYEQYRYMASDATTVATFTNVSNWQGVDDEPTEGSDDLVKSGGVYKCVGNINNIYGVPSNVVIGLDGFSFDILTVMNRLIKSVTLTEIPEGYTEGCIRVINVYCISKAENRVDLNIQLATIINNQITNISDFPTVATSTSSSTPIVDNGIYSVELPRTFWDLRDLFTSTTEYYYNNTIENPYKVIPTNEYKFIDGGVIADNSIGGSKLLDGSVTTNKLVNSAVTTEKVNNLAITDAKIAERTISATKLKYSAFDEIPIKDSWKLINSGTAKVLNDLVENSARVSTYCFISQYSAISGTALDCRGLREGAANFAIGDRIKFKLSCSSGVISYYQFIDYYGTDIFEDNVFLPNQEYILEVNALPEHFPFGVFIPAADVQSDGDVTVEIYPYWENSPQVLFNSLDEKIDNKKVSFLEGKTLVTLCDSLGAASQWQTPLSQLTKCVYNKSLNDDWYSFGGTMTCNASGDCAQDRAKRVVNDGVTPDVIIIENVNDSELYNNYLGSTSDVAYFKTGQTLLSLVSTPASKADAETYWTDNFATIVNDITPSIGHCIGVPFISNKAIKLTITSVPTANGDFGIYLENLGSSYKYIAVTTEDTIADVVNKIVEYSWNNYIVSKVGNDSVLFTPNFGTPSIQIRTGGTGITYTTLANQQGENAIWRYFISRDINDWTDSTKWVVQPSLFASWKGLTEYLQDNFPQTLIYWFIPRTYAFDYTDASYKRADGTIDYDKVLSQQNYCKLLFNKQIEFCDYYNLPYIDIRNESCLTPANLSTYMNVGNVHPKQDCYDRWAEILAKMLG